MRVKSDNTDGTSYHPTCHSRDGKQVFIDMLVSIVLIERGSWNFRVRLHIGLIKILIASIRNLLLLTEEEKKGKKEIY